MQKPVAVIIEPAMRLVGEEAAELLDDMLAAGVSQFEPDPLKALAKAKRLRRMDQAVAELREQRNPRRAEADRERALERSALIIERRRQYGPLVYKTISDARLDARRR